MQKIGKSLRVKSGYLMGSDKIYLIGYNPLNNTVRISIKNITVDLKLQKDLKGYYVIINNEKARVKTEKITPEDQKRNDNITKKIIKILQN